MSAGTPTSPTSAAFRAPLTLADGIAFFVPLLFMAELMMITHSVIHGWLARGNLPTVALAAFSIAFAVNALLSSAFRSLHQIALGFITDRRSVRRIWHFGLCIAALNGGSILLVALTPVGDWVYGTLLGAGPAVVAEARGASLIFAAIFPFQCTRNVAAGLLMVQRHTLLITYGTLLRLLSLGAFLAGFSLVLDGARTGAAALVACIVVEALFLVWFAWPTYRRRAADTGAPPTFGAIWHFAWPVILNAVLENALIVLVNVFVGRLHNADLALAAFGVTRGLLMLMMSPLRNLAQTAQALTRTEADLRVVLRFARRTVLVFMAVIALLVYTPLRDVVLSGVLGLAPALQAAVTPAVLLFVVTPPLWGLASTYRGLLAAARETGVLAVTGLARLGAVVGVSSVCLAWPEVNGAVVGVLAMAGAFACEAALLGRSLRRHLRSGTAFPRAADSST